MTAEYPLIYYILAEVVVVVVVAASVLAIGKRVGVMVEWVTLWLYILLQVGALVGGRS